MSINKLAKKRVVLCIELLKTFSEEELDRFDEFINSSFFNTNKRLCLLFKKIRRYALNIDSLTDEVRLKIYQDVYNKPKNEKQLTPTQKNLFSKALSSLLALAEKYIIIEQLEHNNATQYDLLFPELIKRDQMLLYNRRLKAIQKELDSEQKKDVIYYTKRYNLHSLKADALFAEDKIVKEDNYDDLQYYLDVRYLLEKLNFHMAKITLQNRFGHKTFNLTSFASLKEMLNLPEYKSNVLINLYVLNIDLVEENNEATFSALSKLLKVNKHTIPTNTLKPFYTNLTNYCTKQIAKGCLNYYDYLFEIYNDMHNANLFIKNGVIRARTLKNIITVACRVNEIEWSMEKLSFYINNISKVIRTDVFHYNKGIIAFNQNKFEEALTHFVKVKKIDDTHDLNLRIVRLQCFYETDKNFEIQTQQITHSLKVYINDNKKLSKKQKMAYYNFVSSYNRLYKFKDIPNRRMLANKIKTSLPSIKETLLNFESIREKKWLLSKIILLEKNLM